MRLVLVEVSGAAGSNDSRPNERSGDAPGSRSFESAWSTRSGGPSSDVSSASPRGLKSVVGPREIDWLDVGVSGDRTSRVTLEATLSPSLVRPSTTRRAGLLSNIRAISESGLLECRFGVTAGAFERSDGPKTRVLAPSATRLSGRSGTRRSDFTGIETQD
jgi:hypothetical protein